MPKFVDNERFYNELSEWKTQLVKNRELELYQRNQKYQSMLVKLSI